MGDVALPTRMFVLLAGGMALLDAAFFLVTPSVMTEVGGVGRLIAAGTLVALSLPVMWALLRRRLGSALDPSIRTSDRLALIAQKTSNAVVITDADRRIQWVNEGFTRITGYTLDEVRGKVPGALLQYEGTDPAAVERFREILRSGGAGRVEIQNRGKSGNEYTLDVELMPLHEGRGGRVTGFMAIETDITARQRAEKATRDLRDFLRRTLDAIDAHTVVLGPDGRVRLCNHAWREFAQRNGAATQIGEGFDYLGACERAGKSSAEAARAAAAIRAVLSGQASAEQIEYECHGPDHRRWFVCMTRGFEANGERLAVVSHTNVTMIKEAEAHALAASAEAVRLRAMAESALREAEGLRRTLDQHSMISIADRDGRITDVNELFCRASGYAREELLGQDHRILRSGVHGSEFWEGVWSLVREGRAWRGEVCNRACDGRLYWVDLIITPFSSSDGAVEKYVSIGTDITQRVEQRAQIDQQATRLDLTVRSANLGTWDWNIETGAVAFNDIAQTMLGYAPGAWTPHVSQWEALVHPDDMPMVRRALTDHLEGRTAEYRAEGRLRRADGTWAWILDTGRVTERGADGRPLRAMGVHVDVTERKQMEESLRSAKAAAEAASLAKSEFLANVSHEIRTPLTAIIGYTDLLQETDGPLADPRERAQVVGTIRAAGAHLLTVINDVLDLSKIEADRMTVERVDTRVGGVLEEVTSLLRPRAIGKGIELRVRVSGAVPDRIMTDPTRLRQILMNLVGNAVKFTDAGWVEVTCRAEQATDEGGAERSWLVVEVNDTGAGMSAEQTARLFQPFAQADSTVTRRHGGTGLGLAICRRLSELMGGEVRLVSTAEGAGSRFRVRLPLEPAPGARVIDGLDVTRSEPSRGGPGAPTVRLSGRVLLAEDGPDNQRLIAYHLRRAGATVEIAENGRVALETIVRREEEGQPFDLLVTDIQMPEMDGYTLVRSLRARGGQGVRLPIVALTAHAMAEEREKCLSAGCDDYQTKPIDRAALLAACARWIGVGAEAGAV